MYSAVLAASLYFHYNLLHVSVKFCQYNRLTNVVRIYINSSEFDRLPVTSYHTMFECMFSTKPPEKFNSIAHCSLFTWIIFFFLLLVCLPKTKVALQPKQSYNDKVRFRLHFLFFFPLVSSSLVPPALAWDGFFCLLLAVELFRWIFNICSAKYLFILTEQKLRG